MTKKLKRPVAFLSAFVMVMAMLLYFPSGMFSTYFGLKASAESNVTFEAVAGYPVGNNDPQWGDERYISLLDGRTDTKWCCEFNDSAYVVIKASEPIYVSGYTISTGNDTGDNPGRNPKAWTLSACNDYTAENAAWTTIATISDGELPAENEKSKDFTFTETTEKYQYFKLEITQIVEGNTMQISEFALKYKSCTHQWKSTGTTIAPICTEGGYNVERCSICQATRNVSNGTSAKGHSWVSGEKVEPDCVNYGYTPQTCSVCGAEQETDKKDALGHDFNGENGFCTVCGTADVTPKEPSVVNNVYQIGTAGELYWFAGLVNGTLEGVTQNKSAKAVLTADIKVNSNLLSSLKYDKDGNVTNGTIENCYNKGTVSGTGSYVGGVCGNNCDGTITNCYNTGTVSGSERVGGVCGYTTNGTIENCYNTGAVSGTTSVGGVCGKNHYGTITNCYYDSDKYSGNAVGLDNGGNVTNVEGKTTAQFKSGEVAYLLNGSTSEGTLTWGQTIGTDKYPVLNGAKVYEVNATFCDSSTGTAYSNTTEPVSGVHKYNNGFCTGTGCGVYEPAEIINEETSQYKGYYAIENAGQLYWFAGLVNGTLSGVDQNKSANAVLTADITVNTGVLDASGNLVSNTSGFTSWTPIGYPLYTGTFDGNNHTISGLYFNDTATNYVGLFGNSRGTIKNVGVVDSYFKGNRNVGGVCGYSQSGKIENCYNTGAVCGNEKVGGVSGLNYDCTIKNCYNTGNVTATGENAYVGGVCGFNQSGKIENCYYDSGKYTGNAVGGGAGTSENVEGKTTAQFTSGEVAYLLQSGQTAVNGTIPEVWGQTINTDTYPVLGGAKVYQVNVYAGCEGNPGDPSTGYSNTNAPVYKDHNMTKVPEKAATCTEDGNYDYWICEYESGTYYKDAEGTEKFANFDATVIPAGHNLTKVDAVEPTCTESGHIEYWYCESCKKYFSDAEGTTETTKAAVTIPATGHTDTDKDNICDTCGHIMDEIGAKLAGYSLSLSGNIGVNFYMELSDEVIADDQAYMQFTLPNDKTPQVKVNEAEIAFVGEKKYYVFSCEVAAKEMDSIIKAQIITSDKEGIVYEYTVKDYANYILDEANGYDDTTKAMVSAMLSYGDYAEAYFSGKELTATSEIDAVTADMLAEYAMTVSGTLPYGIEYYGSTLLLESETTIRHYFKAAEGTDVSAYGMTEKDGYYYIQCSDIPAGSLGTPQNISVGEYTISYSPLSYAYAALNSNSTSDNLKNLVKALYLYNNAAIAYMN